MREAWFDGFGGDEFVQNGDDIGGCYAQLGADFGVPEFCMCGSLMLVVSKEHIRAIQDDDDRPVRQSFRKCHELETRMTY